MNDDTSKRDVNERDLDTEGGEEEEEDGLSDERDEDDEALGYCPICDNEATYRLGNRGIIRACEHLEAIWGVDPDYHDHEYGLSFLPDDFAYSHYLIETIDPLYRSLIKLRRRAWGKTAANTEGGPDVRRRQATLDIARRFASPDGTLPQWFDAFQCDGDPESNDFRDEFWSLLHSACKTCYGSYFTVAWRGGLFYSLWSEEAREGDDEESERWEQAVRSESNQWVCMEKTLYAYKAQVLQCRANLRASQQANSDNI